MRYCVLSLLKSAKSFIIKNMSILPTPISQIPFLHLIGQEQENFYQLGIKDRDHFHEIHNHIHALFRLPLKQASPPLKSAMQWASLGLMKRWPQYFKLIDAYAQGLNLPTNKVALALALPELSSCLGAWMPRLAQGCSSFLLFNDQDKPVHARILDFSLAKTFEKNERAILYDFVDHTGFKIFSTSTAGLPFPGLHAMNQAGLTLALHQRFTHHFDFKGRPIFDLTYDLLKKIGGLEEAKEFLKRQSPITTWALILMDSNAKILEAQIGPDGHHFKETQLSEENPIYYTNNQVQGPLPSPCIPYGIESYCLMRSKSAQTKIKKLTAKRWKDEDILKLVSTLKPKKGESAQKWNLDPLTFSTVACLILNPSEQKALFNLGSAPKMFNGQIQCFSNIFSALQTKVVTKSASSINPGFSHLIQAQKDFDLGRPPQWAHEIQMAMEYFKHHQESYIAHFYYLVFRYLTDTTKKQRTMQLQEWALLENKLPPYLEDHRLLFLSRLSVLLNSQKTVTESHFKHPELKRIFNIEQKMPKMLLYPITHSLTYPRADILDVIYAY